MALIRLDAIVLDAGTQIRESISDAVVTEYADRMTEGVTFPPIVVFLDGTSRTDGTINYFLADGFHRTQAALRCQFREIDADVRTGTRKDAIKFALSANKANGHRMTEADKRHAIKVALIEFPDMSQNQMADLIGCSQRHVSTVKDEVRTTSNLPSRVTGKDGKSYPASRRAIAEPAPVNLTGRDRTKAGVAQRRQDIRQMAERGFTTRQIAAAVGITEESVGNIAKVEGVVIHADRVVGRTKRLDANRIVGQMVMDAENLTADVNLIDFSQLDHAQLGAWIHSLNASRRSLTAFIRQLEEEHKKHGEAA